MIDYLTPDFIFLALGAILALVGIIDLIQSSIRKKSKKRGGILLVLGLIAFIVGWIIFKTTFSVA